MRIRQGNISSSCSLSCPYCILVGQCQFNYELLYLCVKSFVYNVFPQTKCSWLLNLPYVGGNILQTIAMTLPYVCCIKIKKMLYVSHETYK